MRQYRSLVRVLDRDLAVRPLPETTRLYDDVRAGRLGPPPVPVAVPAADQDEAAALDEPPAALAEAVSASAAPTEAVPASAASAEAVPAEAVPAEAAAAGTPTWPPVGR